MFQARKKKLLFIGASVVALAAATPAMLSAKPEMVTVTAASTDVDEDNAAFASCLKTHIEKRFFRTIKATPDQEDQLSKIVDQLSDTNKQTRRAYKKKISELIDAVGNNESEPQLRSRLDDIEGLQQKLRGTRVDAMMKAMTVLNPEQKKAMTEKLKQRLADSFGSHWWKEN